MGFRIRGYSRDIPQDKVRDYSLFAIACEGTEREPEYFRTFDGIDRIKVDIIEGPIAYEEDGREHRPGSSPVKVLERVSQYVDDHQLSPENGDSLWCVIDVDRWPQDQIEELYEYCRQKENFHLVISNPCIEIWLLYHKLSDLSGLSIRCAQDAKRALHDIDEGGYYYLKYLPLIQNAIKNAKEADSVPDKYMPELLGTKVYKLGEALLDRIGIVRLRNFVDSLPALEKEILARRKDK